MSRHHAQTPSRTWAQIREAVLRRDDYTCQSCGGYGRLEVDHIKPLEHGGTNEMSNLQTLCRGCHIQKTRAERQGNTRPRYAEGYDALIKELTQ